MKVLIADDNDASCRLLRAILEEEGHQVIAELVAVPDILKVATDHGERKEDCDSVRPSLGIGCQLCLGNLLYRDKAERPLDEFLPRRLRAMPLRRSLCSECASQR